VTSAKRRLVAAALLLAVAAVAHGAPRNIVFVLIDDQRSDALGFQNDFFDTPHLDELASRGVVFENAFVTTSLCSPSRASILTGLYAHRHGVLDNQTPLPEGSPTFPSLVQGAGYRTGFIGKWHMGGGDDSPAPGFDRWVSFPGQGRYRDQTFNIDGQRVPHSGYTTDHITQHAIDFIDSDDDRPFLLYVSHKAVHAPFIPAERHDGSYDGRPYPHPESMADRPENYDGKPAWVRAQRTSWHGVDGMYDRTVDFDQFALDYAETLRAVDDGVGRLVATLREKGLLDSTLLVFTSDNGFLFGEHGLIDKRTMYEPSIRVPLIVHCPELVPAGRRQKQMILNLDFAPTFIEAAGAEIPEQIQGRSFLPLLHDPTTEGRDAFLYEYFWERMFPQTPTVLGIRTERHKLMRYHGIWDRYEMYDLEQDPDERHNLLADYVTRTGIGHVEYRVLGGPTPALESLFGTGSDDDDLKQLFRRLHGRLDELLDETGSLREPSWGPGR
jgi:N-acetylglucosamine-6-sulfatase